MAVMRCLFTSTTLMRRCTMNVFVPETPHPDGKPGFPVIYLLHGRSGDENSYVDHGLRPIAEKHHFIVVMPDAARSFYTNMASGEKYWTFISEEVPKLVKTMFPARTERSETFAAGISMGGCGTLKLGLLFPERFSKLAVLSALTDTAWVGRKEGGMSDTEVASIYGSRTGMIGTDDDILELLKRPVPACGRPELMMRCGDADMLIEINREFVKRAASVNWQIDYAEEAGKIHNWDYWTPLLPEIFEFFSK